MLHQHQTKQREKVTAGNTDIRKKKKQPYMPFDLQDKTSNSEHWTDRLVFFIHLIF